MLEQLKKEILEDGIIDIDEVTKIKDAIYADGIIDRSEADFLFELNDAVSGNDNCNEWTELFVTAITSHVLDDDISNGEVDEDEAKWLTSKIEGDGQIDNVEKALLTNIKEKASKIHPALMTEITKAGV